MKIMVRFTVDACLPTSTDSSAPKRSTASVDDDLADTLGSMSIKRPTPASTNTASSSSIIDVVRAGTQVSQEALVEMTSRSAYFLAQFDWNELYPQLALSQTPALHLGVHERGVFTQLHEWQLDGQAHTRTGNDNGWREGGGDPARYLGRVAGDGGADYAACEAARGRAGTRDRAGPWCRGQLQSGV
jgi:hypothetical protein